jgi:hypothetical protein
MADNSLTKAESAIRFILVAGTASSEDEAVELLKAAIKAAFIAGFDAGRCSVDPGGFHPPDDGNRALSNFLK